LTEGEPTASEPAVDKAPITKDLSVRPARFYS